MSDVIVYTIVLGLIGLGVKLFDNRAGKVKNENDFQATLIKANANAIDANAALQRRNEGLQAELDECERAAFRYRRAILDYEAGKIPASSTDLKAEIEALGKSVTSDVKP